MHKKAEQPVPPMFSKYVRYIDVKRKKTKEAPMSSEQLYSHSQALYTLLLKPVVRSTVAWKDATINIKHLADCLLGYHDHIKSQAIKQ